MSSCGQAQGRDDVRSRRPADEEALLTHEALHHREALFIAHALRAVEHLAMQVLGDLAPTDAFDGVGAIGTKLPGLDPVGERRPDGVCQHDANAGARRFQSTADARDGSPRARAGDEAPT